MFTENLFYIFLFLLRNHSWGDIKKYLATIHETQTLVSEYKFVLKEDVITEEDDQTEEDLNIITKEDDLNVAHERTEGYPDSSSDEEDILSVVNREREKRQIKKLLKKHPNTSKEEAIAAIRAQARGEKIRKNDIFGKWHQLVNNFLVLKNVRRMFFFWKSKSFLEKSIKTSFIKRKLYYKKIREGKELNEKSLSKNWKQFALTDEIKTDMKDLMKQAAEKTKLMVKTAEAQSDTIPTLKERKMYKMLNRFENEKLSMKKT